MKEAIEAVITQLEQKQMDADHGYVAARNEQIRVWHDGYGEGIEEALNLLREVLAQHENYNSRNATEPK